MEDIKVNDQVMVRKKIRSGNLVRLGSVVKLEGSTALVHFPIDSSQARIPVAQLEKTSEKFGGYARVGVSTSQRSFFRRKGLA